MAESLGEPVINPSDSHKEKNQLEKSEDTVHGSSSSRVDTTSDLRVDFREDQDSLYPEYGSGSYRGVNPMLFSQPKMAPSYSRGGYERRHEMYDAEYDKYYPEYDRYLNRHGDPLRSSNSGFYDPYAEDSLYPSSLPHDEAFSPRSRYDLAYSPRQSRYGNQWDYHDDYAYVSPRFKHENRWMEHDYEMDSFSPSYSRYYPSELDMLPGSFPYSSPLHSSPRASHPMNMRTYDRADYYPEEIDRQRSPFSNPTSPQPGLSTNHLNEMPRAPLNSKIPSPRGNQQLMESKPPVPSTPVNHANASNSTMPSAPTGNTSSNANTEESSEKEDENYRIDSKKIMQNLEERTVVLIRNIPNRYKLEDLQQVISTYVDEEYTVLRLPIDAFTKRNLGYAFVSFSDSHEVLKLFLKMNGQRWPNSNSLKKFFMCFAKKQNYVLYENSGENLSNYL